MAARYNLMTRKVINGFFSLFGRGICCKRHHFDKNDPRLSLVLIKTQEASHCYLMLFTKNGREQGWSALPRIAKVSI